MSWTVCISAAHDDALESVTRVWMSAGKAPGPFEQAAASRMRGSRRLGSIGRLRSRVRCQGTRGAGFGQDVGRLATIAALAVLMSTREDSGAVDDPVASGAGLVLRSAGGPGVPGRAAADAARAGDQPR